MEAHFDFQFVLACCTSEYFESYLEVPVILLTIKMSMLSSGGFLQTLSRVNGLQVLFRDFGGGLDLIGDKKEVKSPQKFTQNFLDLLPWMLFYYSKALHFSSSLWSAYRSQGNIYASYFSSFYFHFYFHTIYFQDFIKRSTNATRT